MQKPNSFPRVILFLALLTSLLAGVSAPALVNEFVSAAPMKDPSDGDLSLTMTVPSSDLFPNIGDTVTFTIKVKNNGTTVVTGVTVKDILPSGLTYKSDDGGGTYGNSTGIWAVGSLAAGITAQLKITATVSLTGPKTNVSEVWYSDQSDPDSTPGNGITAEDDYASVVINPLISDLSITKSVNNPTPNNGENIIFTITVSNIGPDPATNVTVKDLLPAGLVWQSDDSGGSYNISTGIWAVGSLVASGTGSSDTLNITAQVTTSGVKTNSAEVWSSDQFDLDSTPANGSTTEDDYASATETPKIADLSLTKTVDNSTPTIGSNVMFTITVSNAGPDIATNVTVQDQLPPDLTYVSDDGGGTYINGTGIWTVGSLTNGTSAILHITATATTSPMITNFAEVWTSDQFDLDSTPGNGSKTEDDHDGSPSADLSLTKTVNNLTPSLGSNVVFTITVSNAVGSLSATNVEVKDLLDVNDFTYVSNTQTGGTYTSANGIWAVGMLPSGTNASLFITATVKKAGALMNFAEVSKSDQFDPDSTPGNLSITEDDDASIQITSTISSMAVIISEVAWAGTSASGSDEWVELYNPGAIPIDITGWQLKDSSTTIVLTGSIPAGGFFLLEDNQNTVSDITADQLSSSLSLTNGGEVLQLLDGSNTVIDSANLNDGAWPAGSESTHGTMERVVTLPDGGSAWFTNTGIIKNGKDADGNDIWGTPKNVSSPTPTPTVTLTPAFTPTTTFTITSTRTLTPTGTLLTPTRTLSPTPTATSTLNLLINEVAWGGTTASSSDEWIELYNPSTTTTIDLTGWKLSASDGSPSINFNSVLLDPGKYYILASSSTVFNDVTVDQTFSGSLSNEGELLKLTDGSNTLVDTANSDGGGWPAGTGSPNYASMERVGKAYDGPSTWATYASTVVWAHDRNNNAIKGTPGKSNWAITVTLTPTVPPTPTRTPTRAPTKPVIILPPAGRLIINEFLTRPGFDWNQDGQVDVYDEFIEIKNIGNANMSISGWKLDDEANIGSNPFTLPAVNLNVGERMVFYGLQTNILLSDGGDTVRLLNPSNKVFDAYTYHIAKIEDQSVCRLPDGNGSWYEDCIPTPKFTNTREGIIPSMPDGEVFESPVCNLPDTLPADFLFAECRGFGANIWDSFYWDEFGWQGVQYIPENTSRWESFVE